MTRLHVVTPAFGLQTASPFSRKADSLLRLSGIPYETVIDEPHRAPRGKLPYLEIDGVVVTDTRNIHAHLVAHHGLTLASGPDVAVCRLVEDHLYWLQVRYRWEHHADAVRDGLFASVPWPVRRLVFGMVRRQVRAALHGVGLSRRPESEQLALAHEDFEALERWLGDAAFFGRDGLSLADLTTHALLDQLLGTLEDPLTRTLRAHPTLVDFHARVEAALAVPAAPSLREVG
jgi:glutathione S-transferase